MLGYKAISETPVSTFYVTTENLLTETIAASYSISLLRSTEGTLTETVTVTYAPVFGWGIWRTTHIPVVATWVEVDDSDTATWTEVAGPPTATWLGVFENE